MNANELELKITGRKESMTPFGLRIPAKHAKVLNREARRHRCKGADLLRTAWQEYMINHNLKQD